MDRRTFAGAIAGSLIAFPGAIPRAAAQKSSVAPAAGAMTVNFRGTDYLHRWSQKGQNEFTPGSEADLSKWRDMVTLNVHEAVVTGDQLAELANNVLTKYKSNGTVLRTDSKPRTPQQPAEHFIGAVLGDPTLLEAAFARFMLKEGRGLVVVYSHRVYGREAGPAMSDWLQANGAVVEKALMMWEGMPSVAALRGLPQTP
jgi:hypothetical protein